MALDRAETGDDYPFLIRDPAEFVDGSYHLNLPDGRKPFWLGEDKVRSFEPGWRPDLLYTGFAPLLILEFRDGHGNTGRWFLDHQLRYIGGHAAELPADLRHFLRLRALPILRDIVSVVDAAEPAPPGAAARAFMGLAEGVKAQVADLLVAELVPTATIYPVADLVASQAPIAFSADRAGGAKPLSGQHLAAGIDLDWQERLVEVARSGTLSWPSPVDGIPLNCRGSVIFDDFFFAYRFIDERFSLVFYVVVSEHHSCVGGIWFPSLGVMVVKNDASRPLGARIADQLPRHLLLHALSWAPYLLPYFAMPPMRFSNILRGAPAVHIGHQLWNELTGIEGLLELVPEPRLKHLVLGQDSRLELYGPIDEIFPSLRGRVRRDLGGIGEMILDSYRSGTIVFRLTREYVPTRLRTRLLADSCRRAAAASIRFPSTPTIMIGLRVENRTLADLDGFLGQLVDMVDRHFPALNLVFDGHNAGEGSGQAISSHGESMARIAPDEVERRIVAKLRHDFPHRSDRIFDTIMQPISTSVAWAHASAGFVSIWGASLAKYRWVANLPGFVISSAHNLRHRGDLDIYHAPRYMQDPTPLAFVDPDLVTDLPEAEQLVPVGGAQPSFANFRLQDEVVLSQIRYFIEHCLADRAAMPQAIDAGV